jgi:hypothetical protein
MRAFGIVVSGVSALLSLALAIASQTPACAGDMPDYFKEIVGAETASPAEVSAKNILALNATMFDLYGSRMQFALDGLDVAPMRDDWRPISRAVLENNIAFMDGALKANVISTEAMQEFAKKQGPLLKKNITWAAQTQVEHWMGVIAGWKDMLGADWDKTYAASNTIYVARQNNVLFSVLAQFFPPEAINDRLMLIETISFTTTPDDMLDALTRIIADRSVGAAFFGDYHLMDYELMGGDARQAVIDEDKKRNIPVNLPPQVPFGSHQWPTLVTPGPGAKSLADLP